MPIGESQDVRVFDPKLHVACFAFVSGKPFQILGGAMARMTKTAGPKTVRVSCENLLTGAAVETLFIQTTRASYDIVFRKDFRAAKRRARIGFGTLTWREVASTAGQLPTMTVWGDMSEWVEVSGIEGWQRALIVALMVREVDGERAAARKFLGSLPEEELMALHERYGLTSESLVAELARIVAATDEEARTGYTIARLRQSAGVAEDAGLAELAGAFEDIQEQNALEAIETLLQPDSARQYDLRASLRALLRVRPPLQPQQRAGLFAHFLRLGPGLGATVPMEGGGDEAAFLQWLLGEQAEDVFGALRATHIPELEAFSLCFLKRARKHVIFFARPAHGRDISTLGRAYHGPWADIARSVEAAALGIGIAIPPRLSPAVALARHGGRGHGE